MQHRTLLDRSGSDSKPPHSTSNEPARQTSKRRKCPSDKYTPVSWNGPQSVGKCQNSKVPPAESLSIPKTPTRKSAVPIVRYTWKKCRSQRYSHPPRSNRGAYLPQAPDTRQTALCKRAFGFSVNPTDCRCRWYYSDSLTFPPFC